MTNSRRKSQKIKLKY